MSRILFVNCYDDMMYGLRTMTTQLEQAGHEVFLLAHRQLEDCWVEAIPPVMHPKYNFSIQTTQVELDHSVSVFEELEPDWVGFSVSSPNIPIVLNLMDRFREIRPDIKIVWGGADVWVNAEDDIQYADVLVLFEADVIITDLAEAMAGEKDLADVPGIWYKDSDGTVHRNRELPPFEDLDSLPFPSWNKQQVYEVSNDVLYSQGYHPGSMVGMGVRTVLTARGCPYTCSYCINGIQRDDVRLCRTGRQRSVESVMRELHWLKDQPETQYIFFTDEVFPFQRAWTEEFAERYRREIGLPFSCYMHPNIVRPWLVECLAKMGPCYNILMGIQSGSDRVNREVFHRFSTSQRAIQAMQLLQAYQLPISIDFISYNPLETDQDRRETLELIMRLPRPFSFQKPFEMMFMRKFAITDMAFDQGHELRQINEHTWLAPADARYRLWDALYRIAGQTQGLSPDLVDALLNNPHFESNPELAIELADKIVALNYGPTITGRFDNKASYIRSLENYYMQKEGSRAVKYYFSTRDWLRERSEKTAELIGLANKQNGKTKTTTGSAPKLRFKYAKARSKR